MKELIEFKCTGDNLEEIPEIVVKKTGLAFPVAHTNMKDMFLLSRELKVYRKDTLCRVPFCVTVEAEAFGANIKLGDMKLGPRVESYLFNSLDQLSEIRPLDLKKGRIKAVLDTVEKLHIEHETVALNVEGPFTIISSLIDPMLFYKGIRKERELIDSFMKVIEDSLVGYILEGIKRGASIISYGDPLGALDIVGPKVYKEISGKTTYNILNRIEPKLVNTVVHLCGKTSTALDKVGFSKSIPIYLDYDMSYGGAIERILKSNKDIKFIGNNCIKKTTVKMKKPVVWKIELL